MRVSRTSILGSMADNFIEAISMGFSTEAISVGFRGGLSRGWW